MSIEMKGLDSAKAGRTETGSAAAVTRAATGSPAAAATTAPADDTVRLTDAAQELSRLEAQVSSVPEVDSRRVEQVRAALANGTYKVDAGAIATNLMKLEAYLPHE